MVRMMSESPGSVMDRVHTLHTKDRAYDNVSITMQLNYRRLQDPDPNFVVKYRVLLITKFLPKLLMPTKYLPVQKLTIICWPKNATKIYMMGTV